MKKPKIAMFAPPWYFYGHLLQHLCNAFTELGHECFWQPNQPSHDEIARAVKERDISLVFEINRVLPSEQEWPKDVAHFAWLQDYRFNTVDILADLGKSDHLYFIIDPAAFATAPAADRVWSILSPGARSDVPQQPPGNERCDFSLCGVIHQPPIDQDVATTLDGTPIKFSAFLYKFPMEVLSQARFSLGEVRNAVAQTCETNQWTLLGNAMVLFDEFLIRIGDRTKILEELLTISKSLEIYGDRRWLKWPQFAPYHMGQLPPAKLDAVVYQSTRVNIHNGTVGMHFRVIDCMAAGGFILVNRATWDSSKGSIDNFFIPDVHYGSYEVDTIAEVAKRYLDDPEGRRRIAADGRRRVLAQHTWKHRAEQILKDYEQQRGGAS